MKLPNFLRPRRDDVERMIRDHHLRADELARQGKRTNAEVERRKAARLERALPRARENADPVQRTSPVDE